VIWLLHDIYMYLLPYGHQQYRHQHHHGTLFCPHDQDGTLRIPHSPIQHAIIQSWREALGECISCFLARTPHCAPNQLDDSLPSCYCPGIKSPMPAR